MLRPHIRGRRRILNSAMQVELCRLISEGSSLEAAAETLDVSLRTVQRNRKEDQDFDHEVHSASSSKPPCKRRPRTSASPSSRK